MIKIFDRLIGLETEYALHHRARGSAGCPTDYQLYSSLVAALQRRLPTALAGIHGPSKPGIFLATGGAVWFERRRLASQIGLIEGSTPECRSPRHLLICQRAQDRLLSEAAQEATDGRPFCLLKNCRDAQGEIYGAQENYEAVLAQGWRLAVWRAAWFLLYPLAIVLFLCSAVLEVLILLANLLFVVPLYLLNCIFEHPSGSRRRQSQLRLCEWFWGTNDEANMVWRDWLKGMPFLLIIMLLLMPFYVLLSMLLAVTDLRQTQRRLLAFLASRAVLGGSGWLDSQGHFHITEKAESRRFVWTEVIPDVSRPVFNLAHFFKMAVAFPPRWKELLAPRQRLQISLGDSNLCDEAEYLRVATTLLVLDAIEAGAITTAPMLCRPLQALRQISRDPALAVAVEVRGGRRMTALEIQRWYLDACRRFVAQVPNAPPEARDVLRRWADVLDLLARDRSALVGRLDWVTKQFLLDQAGAGLSPEARKKIDLRYHELSSEGYFARLQAAGRTSALVTEAEIEPALRFPPPSSPAMKRARYIREFSGTNTLLKVGWRLLEVVTDGAKKTTIDLHDPLP